MSVSIAPPSRIALTSREGARSQLFLPLADILTMLACFTAGGLVNLSYKNVTEERTLILVLLTSACLYAFHYFGHYSRRRPFWQELGDIVTIAGVAFVFDAALLYLLKVNFSRLWVLTSWALVIPAVPLARRAVKRVCLELGGWQQPTVIIGTRGAARDIADAYGRDLHLGYDVVAFLDPSSDATPREIAVGGHHVPVLPLDMDEGRLPQWLGRPHIVLALELDEMAGRESFIEGLSVRHGDLDIISPLKGLPINNARVTHFFSRDLLSLRIHNNLARPLPQLLKRAFDVAAASAILALVAPLMLLVAAKLRLIDKGPVFFAHTRIGRDGRLFRCYKFRTMVPNAREVLEELLANDPEARAEWERDFKLRNDPRITPFGRFLRRTSLDELPQLLNVIRGEMSLVGPRPVVQAELERYGEARVYYLQVRPGLTGLWQISGRNDVDYERRVSLDAWYVRNWTLWYDILILFKTLLVVPSRSNGAY
jgi:undecaprenyl-phosphate galactose phosphotransferase